MKRKRAKARISPIKAGIKPPPEKCWYCGLNADAGAQAAIHLTKPEDDFNYFMPDPEEKKQIITQVEIPRCIECKIAHGKVDNPRAAILFYTLIGLFLAGVYFGIYQKTLSLWSYLAAGIGVTIAVIGIGIGAKRNFLTLPNNIKSFNDVKNETQVQALILKGWKIK